MSSMSDEVPRFALLSEEDMAKLSEKASNTNTKRSTKNWIGAYVAWANARQKNTKLEEYSSNKSEMNRILECFFAELRKKNGKEYEPDCLRVMQGSIQRYLNEMCSIIKLTSVQWK